MDQATAVSDGAPSLFRFSTNDWPAARRVEVVRDFFARTLLRLEVESAPEGPIHIEGDFSALPGLGISDASVSQVRFRRTSAHLDGGFLFSMNLGGSGTLHQCGHAAPVTTGEAFLTNGGEPGAVDHAASRWLTLCIPANAIAQLVPDVEDRVARPIRRDSEALQLLTRYVPAVRKEPMPPEMQRLVVTHVYDLVALALGATRDATHDAKLRGARAARLHAIKSDIENSLGRVDLSVATLAAEHRLPVRYVQRLFEKDGVTFTAYLLERRLARARQMLVNPRLAHQKIVTVATGVGFNNLSYFNLTFRRRYGASPSELRAQARRGN